MDYKLEVVTVPVSDVDRALAFYTRACGFNLDVDYQPNDNFRVVQLTPSGSACSIQIGVGLTDAEPGSARNLCLAVTDIEAARQQLLDRGVSLDVIQRKSAIDDWPGDFADGVDPERRDYASFVSFADPDGNTWTLQEIGFQSGGSP
ncbi:MAG TPA: VOC family protein [Solirubrobacteraceae bacterium]|jgi:catechol 2,3-dioxygenase-like lactoylglutathione lyase family enzyme|nr:VOC family protein [Solirubrobacteraceae bacterium]